MQFFRSPSGSPQSIRTCSVLTEKVICCSPTGNCPTLQYCKENIMVTKRTAQTTGCMCRSNMNGVTDPCSTFMVEADASVSMINIKTMRHMLDSILVTLTFFLVLIHIMNVSSFTIRISIY